MSGAPWTVRLRGHPGQLELPAGAATTLAELRGLVSGETGFEASRVVIKGGFPPKTLLDSISDDDGGGEGEDSKTVADAGITNMDNLVVEGTKNQGGIQGQAPEKKKKGGKAAASKEAAGKEGDAATTRSGRATTCTSERMAAMEKEQRSREKEAAKEGGSSKKRQGSTSGHVAGGAAPKKRVKMPGQGRRLDDDTVELPESAAAQDLQAELGLGGGRRPRGKGSQALGDVEDMALGSFVSERDAAEARLSHNMLDAFQPGKSDNPLRMSLKNARAQQGAIEKANGRCRSALAGEYEFAAKQVAVTGSGQPVQILEVQWQYGSDLVSEVIPDIDREALIAILKQLIEDDDPTMRVNIKPHNMAVISPRVFWSIVRHEAPGPNKTIEAALRALVPGADWELLLSRTQQEKEAGFYRNMGGAGRNKSKAPAKSGAAVEQDPEEDDGEREGEEPEVIDLLEQQEQQEQEEGA